MIPKGRLGTAVGNNVYDSFSYDEEEIVFTGSEMHLIY